MRDWARREGVEIVLPLTERSCVLCNADRTQWEEAGIILGCGSDEMLQSAFDKALTLQRAEATGVRIPPTLFRIRLTIVYGGRRDWLSLRDQASLEQCLERQTFHAHAKSHLRKGPRTIDGSYESE